MSEIGQWVVGLMLQKFNQKVVGIEGVTPCIDKLQKNARKKSSYQRVQSINACF